MTQILSQKIIKLADRCTLLHAQTTSLLRIHFLLSDLWFVRQPTSSALLPEGEKSQIFFSAKMCSSQLQINFKLKEPFLESYKNKSNLWVQRRGSIESMMDLQELYYVICKVSKGRI